MDMSTDAARRYRQVMYPAWTLLDFTQDQFLTLAAIDRSRRSTYWRSFDDPSAKLHVEEARRSIEAVAADARSELDFVSTWDWIQGRTPHMPDAVRQLVLSTALQRRRDDFDALADLLKDVEEQATQKITLAVVPQLSALNENISDLVELHETKFAGRQAGRLRTETRRFIKARRADWLACKRHVANCINLVFHSSLCDFRDGKGPFGGLSSEHAGDGIEDWAIETIDMHEHSIGIIDDRRVPRDQLSYFQSFKGLFATGDLFLMRVPLHGLHRSYCVNADPHRAAFIRDALAKLHELKRYVTHGWSATQMKNAVMRYMPDAHDRPE